MMRAPTAASPLGAYHASSRWQRQARHTLAALMLLTLALPVGAAEVAGVQVDEQSLAADGSTLVLNGAGIRSKFFFKIYVGALYLAAATTDAEAAISMAGAKRVTMHFLYDKIEARKLRDAWTEGFEANQDEAEIAQLRDRIEQFNAMFPEVHEGDRIDIDLDAGGTTRVTVNGTPAGTIEGSDFQRALLRIWIGEHPADGGLKRGMLGG